MPRTRQNVLRKILLDRLLYVWTVRPDVADLLEEDEKEKLIEPDKLPSLSDEQLLYQFDILSLFWYAYDNERGDKYEEGK